MKPNYDNSIMSITNSLLKYYGVKPYHATLTIVDDLLKTKYKNIVLLVMDGMGVNVLEKTLPENAFLRKHMISEMSSVFPPTTTASTVSILSGKTPAEHGWIGWSCYFKEADKCIDLFTNCESGTETPVGKDHLPYKYLSYDNIIRLIGDKVRVCVVSSFSEYFADSIESVCDQTKKLSDEDGEKFVYAYLHQPDHDIHFSGVSTKNTREMMIDINTKIEALADSVSDTLFIITADHGMTDVNMKFIEDYPQIHDALIRHICVEPRCCSFYVKDEHLAMFPEIFKEVFSSEFVLYTHDDFIDSGLLGDGIKHPRIDDFVGDYVAVAISDVALWYKDTAGGYKDFKASHAGLTKEEMTVPLIVIKKAHDNQLKEGF